MDTFSINFFERILSDNISIKIIKVENHEIKLRLARHRLRYTDKFSASRISFIRIAKSDEAYDRRIIVEKAFLSKAKKLSAHKEKGRNQFWFWSGGTGFLPLIVR